MTKATNVSSKRSYFIFLAIAVWATPFHSLASAPTDYFDLPPEQLLSAEVISVSKRAERVSDAPAAVYVITNEDIVRSGVTTIPDALRMAPGVQVARTDSNSWAVNIRGFNSVLSNKLLVLIDGRTVYNPFFGGVLWEAQDTILEDIDRIEVIRGPGGALWGANAVNGVVNIITKHAKDTQGGLASVTYGNEEQGIANIRQGGAFGDDGYYRVFAKTFNRDESHKPSGGNSYDGWESYRTGFRSDWGDRFTLQGDAYQTNTEQLRSEFFLVPPYSLTREQTLHYQGGNILGRWTNKLSDGAQVSVQSYLDYARRSEPYNFIDNRLIYDLETQYNFARHGRHEAIIGGGYRLAMDNEKSGRNSAIIPSQRRDNLYNAFVQDKITLVPSTVFLTLGSKFEINEYSGSEVQPNARLQWHPNERQTVWSSVSRAVRTPTPLEENTTTTLGTGPAARADLVNNRNFQSEELIAYELGYRNQITPDFSIDLASFYNDYDKLATIDVLTPSLVNNGIDPPYILYPLIFGNNMQGKTYGFEVATSWAARSNLKLSTNYSFLNILLDANNNTPINQESAEKMSPTHQAGARLSWNINDDWSLDTALSYVDSLDTSGVDSYLRADINLGWRVKENLRFNLVGQNLLDNEHREFDTDKSLNAAEIQRSVLGKLTWQF